MNTKKRIAQKVFEIKKRAYLRVVVARFHKNWAPEKILTFPRSRTKFLAVIGRTQEGLQRFDFTRPQ